jgi:hypothetical protein
MTISHSVPHGFGFVGRSFELKASPPIGKRITVTLEYRDEDWMDAGIDSESSLRLYYWNGIIWDDVANACGPPIPAYAPNTRDKMLAAPVCHLSEFAIFGQSGGEPTIYLPLILRN